MMQLSKLAASLGFRPKMQKPQPSEPEVLRNTRKPTVGLFGLLTDDQKTLALSGKGDESFGPDMYSLKGKNCA
jgi:hypothetical protein